MQNIFFYQCLLPIFKGKKRRNFKKYNIEANLTCIKGTIWVFICYLLCKHEKLLWDGS